MRRAPSTLPRPSGHDARAKEAELGKSKGIPSGVGSHTHTCTWRKPVLVPTHTVGLPVGYEQGG